MKSKFVLIIITLLCLPPLLFAQNEQPQTSAAQVTAPEDMALIPAGKFWMGRSHTLFLDSIDIIVRDRMDDIPANNVYLDSFYIDKYKVTNADYARFIRATGIKAPWHWPQAKVSDGQERFPVYNVSWFEAADYCKSAGKRLPTEAEWEKAARGGLDRNLYSWGDNEINTFDEQGAIQQGARRNTNQPVQAALGRSGAMDVGSFAPNGYGLYDMVGNLMEWTTDWYDSNYYPFMPKENPRGPETGLYKSIRGASWTDNRGHGDTNTVHYRKFTDPETRMSTIGFRCAKDP